MKKGTETNTQTDKPRLYEVVSISFSKDKKKKKKRKPMSAPPTTPVSVRYAQYVVNSKKRQDERT
jgi:phage terminase large subunit